MFSSWPQTVIITCNKYLLLLFFFFSYFSRPLKRYAIVVTITLSSRRVARLRAPTRRPSRTHTRKCQRFAGHRPTTTRRGGFNGPSSVTRRDCLSIWTKARARCDVTLQRCAQNASSFLRPWNSGHAHGNPLPTRILGARACSLRNRVFFPNKNTSTFFLEIETVPSRRRFRRLENVTRTRSVASLDSHTIAHVKAPV